MGSKTTSQRYLSEAFLAALAEDFEEHSVAVIQRVREEQPDQYFKIVASVIPKEIVVEAQTLDDVTNDEIRELIVAIQRTGVTAAIPEFCDALKRGGPQPWQNGKISFLNL